MGSNTHQRVEYGIVWEPYQVGDQTIPVPDFVIHRDICLGRHGSDAWLTPKDRAFHFMRFCDTFFSDPQGLFYMQWNPNAVKIVENFFEFKMLSIMGCASSGKSFALACIAIGMFLLDPKNTKVLVTSTTVQTAKGKIWGDICYAWDQVCAVHKKWGIEPPGKKMSGDPIIRYEWTDAYGERLNNHKRGLELVPTQQSSEKQSMEKLQGYKSENVIFIGDEWDTLSHGLVNTVNGNLKSNKNSRCLAAFNPTGRTSPGGKISKPVNGWESITEDSLEWETDYGYCIRFDALKSPNVYPHILPEKEKWKGLPDAQILEDYKKVYGDSNSLEYWKMVRGWFPPTGEATSIYSEAELMIQYQCDHKVNTWLEEPVMIAGVDPGYAHDGDYSFMVVGKVGLASVNGRAMTVCERVDTINIDISITDKTKDKSEQVVREIASIMQKHGIEVRNLAVDISGAGAFQSLLAREIGTGFIGAIFNERPTSMPISKSDSRKACDVYEDLVTELWYGTKPLIREGQIKGIDPDTIEEMCQRSYFVANKGKIKVEPKRFMKKRLHKSPDRTDAFFLMVYVAKMRHGLVSTELAANHKARNEPLTELDKFFQANPNMIPKKPSRFRKRERYEPLEHGSISWG